MRGKNKFKVHNADIVEVNFYYTMLLWRGIFGHWWSGSFQKKWVNPTVTHWQLKLQLIVCVCACMYVRVNHIWHNKLSNFQFCFFSHSCIHSSSFSQAHVHTSAFDICSSFLFCTKSKLNQKTSLYGDVTARQEVRGEPQTFRHKTPQFLVWKWFNGVSQYFSKSILMLFSTFFCRVLFGWSGLEQRLVTWQSVSFDVVSPLDIPPQRIHEIHTCLLNQECPCSSV